MATSWATFCCTPCIWLIGMYSPLKRRPSRPSARPLVKAQRLEAPSALRRGEPAGVDEVAIAQIPQVADARRVVDERAREAGREHGPQRAQGQSPQPGPHEQLHQAEHRAVPGPPG